MDRVYNAWRSSSSGGKELNAFGFDGPGEVWLEHVRAVESPTGGRIGTFEIIGEVDRGGQGIVYRARQPGLQRDIALKRLLCGSYASEASRKRFEREIEIASALRHPHIVTVFGMDIVGGQPLLAMEWVDGRSITTWAVEGPDGRRSTAEIVDALIKVGDAVHHAHQHGVIHRDLKPSNILVDKHGEPRVLDFGLAKLVGQESIASPSTPQSRSFAGTPAYASPEQIEQPAGRVDLRTDVYALGLILFEMLTGQMPYPVDGALAATIDAIRTTAPTRPRSLNERLDRDLEWIILKAIAKCPNERYQSVEALTADLRRYRGGQPVLAHPPSHAYHLGKLVRRHRLAFSLCVTSCMLIVGFAITALVQARSAIAARENEQKARHVAEKSGKFLRAMLASASPNRRGGDVTVVQILGEAASRVERDLAGEPEAAADIYATIALTYYNLWLTKKSEPYWRSALRLYRRVHGDINLNVANCLSMLGHVLSFQDREEAIEVQREALRVKRALYASDHRSVIQGRRALGFALYRGAHPPRYAEAEQQLLEALRLARQRFGDTHTEVAGTLYTYAAMLSRQGRHDQAIETYREALAMTRALFGKRNVRYIECLDDFASCLVRAGRYDEAIAHYKEVIDRTRSVLGEAWITGPMMRLATAHHRQQDLASADALFRKALTAYVKALVLHAPELPAAGGAVLTSWSQAPAASGDKRSVGQLVNAIATLTPEQHFNAALCARLLIDYARLLADRNETRAAKACARESIRLHTQVFDETHWRVADAKSVLGGILTRERRFEEAEPLLLSAHERIRRARGDESYAAKEALDRVLGLYDAWGKPERTAEYQARPADISQVAGR